MEGQNTPIAHCQRQNWSRVVKCSKQQANDTALVMRTNQNRVRFPLLPRNSSLCHGIMSVYHAKIEQCQETAQDGLNMAAHCEQESD